MAAGWFPVLPIPIYCKLFRLYALCTAHYYMDYSAVV